MKVYRKFQLYKYIPLSEEKHFKRLEGYLKQDIYLTELSKLNDKNEGKFNLINITPDQVLQDPVILRGFLKHHNDTTEPDLTEEELIRRLKIPEYIAAVRESAVQLVDTMFCRHGSLSLTDTNSSERMWTTYSDNNKGVCIGFEVDFHDVMIKTGMSENQIQEFFIFFKDGCEMLPISISGEPVFVFTKVRYVDVLPTIDLWTLIKKDKYDALKYIAENSVGAKLKTRWSYEREFRLVAISNGPFNLLNLGGLIKVNRVILGNDMPKQDRSRAIHLCNQHGIKLLQHNALVNHAIINVD
jgi:hypothetical protein